MNPRYPIYVISKGRWESRLTVKALERMSVPHSVVIEPQERDAYAKVMDPAKLLVLPFSNLGQGSIPARNWLWEHSSQLGAERHWVIDDNIRGFHRLHDNRKIPVMSGAFFRPMEDFADRYENVALCGPQYWMFAPRKNKLPAFTLNTRIYSCILVKNDLTYRWRGRYNEDTDLSLRALKDGWATVLFYAFIIDKMTTMSVKGGNTEALYKIKKEGKDGRLIMAESIVEQHPDVARVSWKFGRWQHHVDYRPFARNPLKLRAGVNIPEGVNNYGMTLEVDEEVERANALERFDDQLLMVKTDFLHAETLKGKTIDEALAAWSEYKKERLREKGLETCAP